MPKKYLIIGLAVLVITAGGYFLLKKPSNAGNGDCVLNFYYFEGCPHCQQVEDEGTLEKIEKLGISVKKIDVNAGPINENIQQPDGKIYTPTFTINGKVMQIGYISYDDLIKLIPSSCIRYYEKNN